MNRIIEIYNLIMKLQDDRVSNWFLLGDPWQPLLVIVIYAFSVLFGIKFMRNREPFELKLFLRLYNLFQVLISFYIFIEIVTTAIQSRYSLICEPVDYSNNPLSIRMATALWLYYLTKVMDLLDTILFVLRKKHNQITFLHVFHHVSMVKNGWLGAKFVPGGQTFLITLLNSLVHTVMYSYYGLSTFGPSMQKYLWWKKYLTQFQMVQFFLLLIHSTVNYLTECSYPKGFDLAFIGYSFTFMLLFLNFYRISYLKEKKTKEQAALKKTDAIKNGYHQNGHLNKKHS